MDSRVVFETRVEEKWLEFDVKVHIQPILLRRLDGLVKLALADKAKWADRVLYKKSLLR